LPPERPEKGLLSASRKGDGLLREGKGEKGIIRPYRKEREKTVGPRRGEGGEEASVSINLVREVHTSLGGGTRDLWGKRKGEAPHRALLKGRFLSSACRTGHFSREKRGKRKKGKFSQTGEKREQCLRGKEDVYLGISCRRGGGEGRKPRNQSFRLIRGDSSDRASSGKGEPAGKKETVAWGRSLPKQRREGGGPSKKELARGKKRVTSHSRERRRGLHRSFTSARRAGGARRFSLARRKKEKGCHVHPLERGEKKGPGYLRKGEKELFSPFIWRIRRGNGALSNRGKRECVAG